LRNLLRKKQVFSVATFRVWIIAVVVVVIIIVVVVVVFTVVAVDNAG
jgi:hypothetical protein